MSNLYDEFEMNMNGTPVKFSAWQTKKGDIAGKFTIKYQTFQESGMDWSKLYDPGIRLSLFQWQHFQHDINPSAPMRYLLRTTPMSELMELSAQTFSTVRGESEHLGRGNSWNGYRFGPNVVKLSSIVPYVWQNSHAYLSVAESHAQAMKEVELNRLFFDNSKLQERFAWINRVEHVGQKVAVTMPYLASVDQLTQDQAEYLEETIHRMHRLGYAYLDQEIGFGLDLWGTPKIYDLSTVRHRSETRTKRGWTDWIEDDLSMLDRLREKHGLGRSKTSQLRSNIRRRQHDKLMESIRVKKNVG